VGSESDRRVRIKNFGTTAAYVATLFAVEILGFLSSTIEDLLFPHTKFIRWKLS
jgi:hypothetical protein